MLENQYRRSIHIVSLVNLHQEHAASWTRKHGLLFSSRGRLWVSIGKEGPFNLPGIGERNKGPFEAFMRVCVCVGGAFDRKRRGPEPSWRYSRI